MSSEEFEVVATDKEIISSKHIELPSQTDDQNLSIQKLDVDSEKELEEEPVVYHKQEELNIQSKEQQQEEPKGIQQTQINEQQQIKQDSSQATFETFLNRSIREDDDILDVQTLRQQFNLIDIKKKNDYSDQTLKDATTEIIDLSDLPKRFYYIRNIFLVLGSIFIIFGLIQLIALKREERAAFSIVLGFVSLLNAVEMIRKSQLYKNASTDEEREKILKAIFV